MLADREILHLLNLQVDPSEEIVFGVVNEVGHRASVQVSGPLNAAEICKLAVDSKIHLAIVFLAIVPSNHDNLNFPGYILEIPQNRSPAGKIENSPQKKKGPLNAGQENLICGR